MTSIIHAVIDELSKTSKLSDEVIALLRDQLQIVHLKKGDNFLKVGEVSRQLGFIFKGLTMVYQLHDGTEVPLDFAVEGNWVACLKSFMEQQPSDRGIKTLEDTTLLTLSVDSLEKLTDKNPKATMELKNHYITLSFIRVAQHGSDLSMLTAKERYEKFVKENPKLINRIPLYHVAAYLGIKSQSLSRIRKAY
jgi:CRP-like cAMP-binding protein